MVEFVLSENELVIATIEAVQQNANGLALSGVYEVMFGAIVEDNGDGTYTIQQEK